VLEHDSARGVTVLTVPGLSNLLTWELSGSTWTLFDGGTPLTRKWAPAAFEANQRRMVIFGGYSDYAQDLLFDTWMFDGTRWAPLPLDDPEGDLGPFRRCEHTLTYDPARRRIVLFGGRSSPAQGAASSYLDDLWELEVADGFPSHTLRVPLDHRDALPLGATVVALQVRAIAGASSEVGGAATDGARLGVWLDGAFIDPSSPSTAFNDAGPQRPARLDWAAASPAQAARLLGRRELAIAVMPLGVNGSGTARLALDAIETEIHFRLP
jgi:hypothetical protein